MNIPNNIYPTIRIELDLSFINFKSIFKINIIKIYMSVIFIMFNHIP